MQKIRGLGALPENACYAQMNSPVGVLTMLASSQGLHAVLWDKDQENLNYQNIMKNLRQSESEETLLKTKEQLTEYFRGARQFFNLPLVLGGTDFQIQAWQQLIKIPYATTITYAEQAQRMGDKKKARAVGMANGKNPISIIVPCHRVIGSNGSLTGFAGGLDKKARLLRLEEENGER